MAIASRPPDVRHVLEPGVIEAIGLEAMGLLCWLTAQASPASDLPGGWVVGVGVREARRILHMGNDKWLRLTGALQAAGLVYVEPGKRFGQGGGSTPNRYWLTYDNTLPSPNPHAPPPRGSQFGHVQTEHPQDGYRHLVSIVDNSQPVAAPSAGTSAHSVHVDDGFTSSSKKEHVPDVLDAPGFLVEALQQVGWNAPLPTGVDPLLVTAVARHLSQSGQWQRPAGMLNKLISQGKLHEFALLNNLLSTDPTGTLNTFVDTAPAPSMMPYAQLTEYQIEFPDWYDQVCIEARRLSADRGISMSMALIREAAASMPPPGYQANERTS